MRWRTTILLVLLSVILTGCASKDESTEYAKAYEIGLKAYVYGFPLMETNRTFLEMTGTKTTGDSSTEDPSAPVNRFLHIRNFNNSGSTAVVAPGASGLSSIAWLDLSEEPQVLHIPAVKGNFYLMALLDPYTEDLCNLGSAHATQPGDYVICGPGQWGALIPPGFHQINVDASRIWVIGSIQVKGEGDVPNVNNIQDEFTIRPLNESTGYQGNLEFQANAEYSLAKSKTNGIDHIKGLEYFDDLCYLLAKYPPPEADSDTIKLFETVGIGPGRIPSLDRTLSAETVRGLIDAAASGQTEILKGLKEVYVTSALKHNGYFVGGFGNYGMDYKLRAAVTRVGLGAVSSDQTIFALASTDSHMNPLDGGQKYIMHMADLPPATEGWSITVYNSDGALVENPIDRYQFSERSKLSKNADGSIDIYLQAKPPGTMSEVNNWLPVPDGEEFQVIVRILAPKSDQISGILAGTGWQPPAILPNNR